MSWDSTALLSWSLVSFSSSIKLGRGVETISWMLSSLCILVMPRRGACRYSANSPDAWKLTVVFSLDLLMKGQLRKINLEGVKDLISRSSGDGASVEVLRGSE